MYYRDRLRAAANYNPAHDAIDLYLMIGRFGEDKIGFPKPIEFEMIEYPASLEVVHSGKHNDPFLSLTREAAAYLMNDLWSAGVRPTDHRDVSEIIQAKNGHIHDLNGRIEYLEALVERFSNQFLWAAERADHVSVGHIVDKESFDAAS
jgi:hypothetical protein